MPWTSQSENGLEGAASNRHCSRAFGPQIPERSGRVSSFARSIPGPGVPLTGLAAGHIQSPGHSINQQENDMSDNSFGSEPKDEAGPANPDGGRAASREFDGARIDRSS